MASRNPAFSKSPAFRPNNRAAFSRGVATSTGDLETLYQSPAATAADTDRMTYDDTIGKTALIFLVLLVAAGVGWMVPALAIPGAIAGFVLAMVNSFKRVPSAPLIFAYAATEGLFVGGISEIFEQMWGGVVLQAVLGTLVVFGVTLALFASGKIRASKRATKIFLIAMVGYILFSFINMGLMMFGGVSSSLAFGLRSQATIFGIPLGIIVGLLAVLMAAYSLVLDFDFIKNGVANRAPRAYGWYGAFGLMVTIVWLYIEMLRLFAIARN